MLELKNVSASIEDTPIFMNLSHIFENNSLTAILGHNGSGKSSLALSLLGHPRYEIEGEILLNNEIINDLSPSDRHNKGMFLSFQNVPEIPGIKVIEYLRTIYNSHFARQNIDKKSPSLFVFRRMVEKMLDEFHVEKELLDRELFVGFSGGEKRKIELLQIALLNPKIIILDEIDSGLDINAMNILSEQIIKWHKDEKIIIIISHNLHLLQRLPFTNVLIMKDGEIIQQGDKKILSQIETQGFMNN